MKICGIQHHNFLIGCTKYQIGRLWNSLFEVNINSLIINIISLIIYLPTTIF